MSVKLPDVSSPYGAPMGRTERHDPTDNHKFNLQRVRLNAGGYDKGGAYWGIGQPLFWYESVDCKISDFIRARDRNDAKAKVRERYPSARFFR